MNNKIRKEVQLILSVSALIVLLSTMATISAITYQNVFAAKPRGVFSPTGYCVPGGTTCLPCDPGIPGANCIPSGNWPGGTNNQARDSDLGQIGGQPSTVKKSRGLNDNSPTPPACPDKGPIPPDCTLKPTPPACPDKGPIPPDCTLKPKF